MKTCFNKGKVVCVTDAGSRTGRDIAAHFGAVAARIALMPGLSKVS